MKNVLTVLEASKKGHLSPRRIRALLAEGRIQGRQAPISESKLIWLVDSVSLSQFLKKKRTSGRPKRSR